MTSIHSENYAAALKILEFVEEFLHHQRQNENNILFSSATSENNLFTKAILSPSRNGATPIQALLASLSSFYDIQPMRLYVLNLPVNYTAQHLLKLFQVRYPSVFKAEIVKGGRDGDEGAESSEDEEDEGWSSGGEEGGVGYGEVPDEEESRQLNGERNLMAGMLRRSGKWSPLN